MAHFKKFYNIVHCSKAASIDLRTNVTFDREKKYNFDRTIER